MKKIILFIFTALFSISTFAGGGWADCAVNLTKDGGEGYLYSLGNESWSDGNWITNTNFDGLNLGTPTSLILNGAEGDAWTDDNPGYNPTSFILYYRVYKSTDTPGSWAQIALDNQNLRDGNNYVYDKTNAAVDILALATQSGSNTYTLEIAISKNQYYDGGNWNSMIPGGQAVAYDSSIAGYKATFTKSVLTDIRKNESSLKISTGPGKITAHFNGSAKVQLFTSTGQLISSTNNESEFSKVVNSGVYLLRVDGVSHKVVVQ